MSYTQDEILDLTGWSRATFLRRRKNGDFPSPINPVGKPLLWRYDVVDSWLDDEANNPPNAVDRLITNRYGNELQEWIDGVSGDQADDVAREEFLEVVADAIQWRTKELIADYRDDALEKALVQYPDADESEIEVLADTIAHEAASAKATTEINSEYGPQIDARRRHLAKRFAMAEMRKWLRRGKKDE